MRVLIQDQRRRAQQEPLPETSVTPMWCLKGGAITHGSDLESNSVLSVSAVVFGWVGGGVYEEACWSWIRALCEKYSYKQDLEWKYFFLVRGTLLILINNVLVKCYSVFFFFSAKTCRGSGIKQEIWKATLYQKRQHSPFSNPAISTLYFSVKMK